MISPFSIACRESRVEHPRSFYGSFVLGAFEPDQSLTIANTLRRTLLSDLPGFAITSVSMPDVTHNYSVLPGLQESVQEVFLNLKQLVFRNTNLDPLRASPQVAYLHVRGPGVIRAQDIKLPIGLQCVDPDQYIATLVEDGTLEAKLFIQAGKKYVVGESGFDAVYMPVQRVNYIIERSEVWPHQDRIVLEIWTNGSLHPRQALGMACKQLIRQFCKLDRSVLV